jgi:hypothetical protein
VRGSSFDGGVERQNTPSQQDESRPPVHLALQQFQAVDLAFDLPVTPGLLKAGDDGRMITSYSGREATEFFDARGGGRLQPGVQFAGCAVLDQVAKSLRQTLSMQRPQDSLL